MAETIPGGSYLTADGRRIDAHGAPIAEPKAEPKPDAPKGKK